MLTLLVIDNDAELRASIHQMLADVDVEIRTFSSAGEFLDCLSDEPLGCILLDVPLSGSDGLKSLRALMQRGVRYPIIAMSEHADAQTAVAAIEEGAVSFLQKPLRKDELLGRVEKATQRLNQLEATEQARRVDELRLEALTPREREILGHVACGEATKNIALRLGVSARTIDKHRENILAKTRAASWAELISLALRLKLSPPASVQVQPSTANQQHPKQQ